MVLRDLLCRSESVGTLKALPGLPDPCQRFGRGILDNTVIALLLLLKVRDRGRGIGSERGQCAGMLRNGLCQPGYSSDSIKTRTT